VILPPQRSESNGWCGQLWSRVGRSPREGALDRVQLQANRVPGVSELNLHGVVDGVDGVTHALDLKPRLVDGDLNGVENLLLVREEAGLVLLPGIRLQDLVDGTRFRRERLRGRETAADREASWVVVIGKLQGGDRPGSDTRCKVSLD
jgi:hypothetical protein